MFNSLNGGYPPFLIPQAKAVEYDQIKNRIDQYGLEREMIIKSTDTLAQSTQIMSESDHDLEEKMRQYSASISKQASAQEELQAKKNDNVVGKEGVDDAIQVQLALQGTIMCKG